jgi:hypothetical protein
MPSTPEPPDINPYVAPEVTEVAASATDRRKPGTVAVVISVVLGLVVAVFVFAATFFFTCVGVMSTRILDNEFGMLLIFLVASLTTVAAFVFAVRGFLKIARTMSSTNPGLDENMDGKDME